MNDTLVIQDADIHQTRGPWEVVSVINKRNYQQDAVALSQTLWALADGMGGHPRGDEASLVALRALADSVPGPVTCDGLTEGFRAAQDAVAALADGDYRNPGTTLVAVALDVSQEMLNGAWVGDSRAYLIDAQGRVSPLTRDHTTPWGSIDRCLGDHEGVNTFPETFQVPLQPGTKVLLCSDGVHGPLHQAVDPDGVLSDLAARGLEHLVQTLAGMGTDNATAVLIDLTELRS